MAKPAYVWDGTQWVAFSGPEGRPGPGLNIRGLIDDVSKLPAKGDPGDGFITNDDGHLHTWRGSTNTWADNGQFRGPKGPAGETLKISGVVANESSLPATAQPLEVFMAQDTSHLYIYDTNSPAASAGPTPPVGYVDLGAIAGPQGLQGIPGPVGPAGTAAFFASAVDTVVDLPATGTPGEMRMVNNTGHVHSWDSTTNTWKDSGLFKKDGAAAFMGTPVRTVGDLPIAGRPGEVRLVEDTQHLHSWDALTGAWVDAGGFKTVVDGTADGDILRWDGTLNDWEAVANQFGAASNVTFTDDGGVPVYDQSNFTWNVRSLVMDDLGDVDTTSTPPTQGDNLVFDAGAWVPKAPPPPVTPVAALDDLTDVTIATPTDHQVLRFNQGSQLWSNDTFNFMDLGDVDDTAQPNLGDTPVFRHNAAANKNEWKFQNPDAFIKDWAIGDDYVSGMTVYHQGRLWRATRTSKGVEPTIADGATHILIGKAGKSKVLSTPVQISGTAPSATPPNGGISGNWYAVEYVSDQNVKFYEWKITGFNPATLQPTGAWRELTFINGISVWRNVALPPPDPRPDHGLLWIYGAEGNTFLPKIGQTDWTPINFGDFLVSLADVNAATAAAGDLLISDGKGKWNAGANPSYSKAEVDKKVADAIQGLSHGEAIQGIIGAPPANPVKDELYIVGATGTGGGPLPPAFAGHANDLTYWDGAAWVFITPQTGEAHLNESDSALYSFNGTTWVKIGLAGATGPAGPAGANGTSIKAVVMTLADYQSLPVKDTNTIYLLEG